MFPFPYILLSCHNLSLIPISLTLSLFAADFYLSVAVHIIQTLQGAAGGKKIKDEVSITPGYEFNKQNSITAKSGKNKYNFDIAQQNFAWIADNKIEKKMIRTMKKGSRIMISGYNSSGSQTIDHYSLLGFTKAYNEAKKSCS